MSSVSKEKTLKQQLQDKYGIMPEDTITQEVIQVVRAWLEQKPTYTRLSLSMSDERMDSEWVNKKRLLEKLDHE